MAAPSVYVIYDIASAADAADLLQREYGFIYANASDEDKGEGMQIRPACFVKVGKVVGGWQRFTGALKRRSQGRKNQIPDRVASRRPGHRSGRFLTRRCE